MKLDVIQNISLKAYNTFGLDVAAEYFCRVTNLEMLRQALDYAERAQLAVKILGGGSNVILKSPQAGLVIHIALKGIDIEQVGESSDAVTFRIGAGENWHDFVRWTLAQGYSGLENLSLIPGSVGAAPVQNIGAYGVELQDRLVAVEAMEICSGKLRNFSKEQCQFAYRDSVFKGIYKSQFVITSVSLNLTRQFSPVLAYADLARAFDGQSDFSALQVSDVVIKIRQKKLPDPAVLGNAGSFFKNPVLEGHAWAKFQSHHPEISAIPQAEGAMKLSAARLIDSCGFKGRNNGGAGVSEKHALVLVNRDKATTEDVYKLSRQIMTAVKDRFDITLDIEPVWF